RTGSLPADHFCGTATPTFRIATFNLNCALPGDYVFEPGVFRAAQIYGHAAADGVIAVAAADYREIDSNGAFAGGAGQIDVEAFSSLGGSLAFFFDRSGRPFSDGPQYRFKPDLAAPDGTNNSFFGADIAGDADAFPNFFGTSAAAPHAAAVAALVIDANAALRPAEVWRILNDTARDIESAGLDPLGGAGVVDALAAVGAAGASGAMPGDCDGDGSVAVAELIRAVSIALSVMPLSDCGAADGNGDGQGSVDELVAAVDAALGHG